MRNSGRTLFIIVLFAITITGCKARKSYPDPNMGWHSADYTVIFGRLQRVAPPPPSSPDVPPQPPAWTIRFGDANDAYAGELALTPPERLVGYIGGEKVEVRGHLYTQRTAYQYNGLLYAVDSIRQWVGHQ